MDDHIYNRGHLTSDLKWRHAATRGIIIFPEMQQFSLLVTSIFSGQALHSVYSLNEIHHYETRTFKAVGSNQLYH